jgi:hypothetical protein
MKSRVSCFASSTGPCKYARVLHRPARGQDLLLPRSSSHGAVTCFRRRSAVLRLSAPVLRLSAPVLQMPAAVVQTPVNSCSRNPALLGLPGFLGLFLTGYPSIAGQLEHRAGRCSGQQEHRAGRCSGQLEHRPERQERPEHRRQAVSLGVLGTGVERSSSGPLEYHDQGCAGHLEHQLADVRRRRSEKTSLESIKLRATTAERDLDEHSSARSEPTGGRSARPPRIWRHSCPRSSP